MTDPTNNLACDARLIGEGEDKPAPTSVPKVAHVGTQMLRRADVRSAALKIRSYAVKSLKLAEEEGRDHDREFYLAKVRTATAIADEIFHACPIFINAQETEARAPATSPAQGD